MIQVVDYDIRALTGLLSELSGAPRHVVESKLHRQYFHDYFNELNAKTIVVEHDYVDRDFLEDFAAYYVRCFRSYERSCARLHFFASAFDQSAFDGLLCGNEETLSAETLKSHYLGFVVVKPLPKTIVGRTCLATYPTNDGRCYPACRPYDAHLCGIPLTVNTVAFQEQDTVVAACATSALWSIFQCTAQLFGHAIPSPVEITKAASERANIDTRMLPNPGLTTVQMAEAIRTLPLEPFLVGAEDPHTLQATAYAYLKARIPIMLGVKLYGIRSNDAPELRGYHAVAVTGFRLGDTSPPTPDPKSSMLLRSRRITKLYAHDDQVGPFAKMAFDWSKPACFLTTSWGHQWKQYQSVNAAPTSALVPLYHKIRIPFGVIQDILIPFDSLIEHLRTQGIVNLTNRLEWDVHLMTTNDLKDEILRDELPVDADTRREMLLQPMPRFMWRALCLDNDAPVMDILFVATDIEQGSYVVRANEYDAAFSTVIRGLATEPAFQQRLQSNSCWQIFAWLLDN